MVETSVEKVLPFKCTELVVVNVHEADKHFLLSWKGVILSKLNNGFKGFFFCPSWPLLLAESSLLITYLQVN